MWMFGKLNMARYSTLLVKFEEGDDLFERCADLLHL